MKKYYLSLFILVCSMLAVSNTAQAQPFALDWVKQINGTFSPPSVFLITTDNSNSMISSGRFTMDTDFDPGPGTHFLYTESFMTMRFITKLDSNGVFQWAVSFPFALNIKSMTTDNDGNIYVTGDFSGTVDVDPGLTDYLLTAVGADDIFILKLSSNGAFVWAHGFGGTQIDNGIDIKITTDNKIIATGLFRSSVDFDPGAPSVIKTSVPTTLANTFVLSLDTAGNFIYVRQFTGSYNAPQKMKLDSDNNIYLLGDFYGTVNFNETGTPTYSATYWDRYVVKMNAMGTILLVKHFPDAQSFIFKDIAIDSDKNMYITGIIQDTQDVDPGPGIEERIPRPLGDAFLLKLNETGNYVWDKIFGNDTENDNIINLEINRNDSLYISGTFKNQYTYPTITGTDTISSIGDADLLLLIFNQDGQVIDLSTIGSTGQESVSDMKLLKNGHIIMSGTYNQEMDFDPSFNEYRMTPLSIFEPYFLKLKPCNRTFITAPPIIACERYIVGMDTIYESGTYYDTFTAINGCDSIVILDITINGTGVLPAATVTGSGIINADTISIFNTSCEILGTVGSAGNLGTVTIEVDLDPSESTYNDQPYIKRHYHITADNNHPSIVTLYFTNDEFESYNANNGTFPDIDLLTGASNLLITAFHSERGSGTGIEGYSDDPTTIEVITPTTVWNATIERWEVSFNTAGFSGFFAHTNVEGTPLNKLLLDFNVEVNGDNNKLAWEFENLESVKYYSLEKSHIGQDFKTIAIFNDPNLINNYLDTDINHDMNYYRLKLNMVDQSIQYSTVLVARNSMTAAFDIYPNPIQDFITIRNKRNLTEWKIQIFNLHGKLITQVNANNSSQEKIDLQAFPAGYYTVQISYDNEHVYFPVIKE